MTLVPRGNRSPNWFEGARPWFASYLSTYLEREIRLVFDIGKLSDFQVLVGLVVARVSQEQQVAVLVREIGVSGPAVDAWLSALHASYLIVADHTRRAAALVGPLSEKQGYRVSLQVIYRGESKTWPWPGIGFVNFLEIGTDLTRE